MQLLQLHLTLTRGWGRKGQQWVTLSDGGTHKLHRTGRVGGVWADGHAGVAKERRGQNEAQVLSGDVTLR